MKTLKSLTPCILIILLFSCNEGDVSLKPGTSQYYVLEQMQNSRQSEFFRGQEKLGALREMSFDKSEVNRASHAASIYNQTMVIDKTVADFLRKIRDLKKEMIIDVEELNRLQKHVENRPIFPFSFQLEKIQVVSNQNNSSVLEGLKSGLVDVRTSIVKEVTTYDSKQESIGKYSFDDPNLNDFESFEIAYREIELAILNSNVAQDDKEFIKKIYVSLTKDIFQLPNTASNSIELFTLLTAVEQMVLSARADAFSMLRSRIGGEGYPFDQILPYVDCPAVAFAGDTITIGAMMAAFDSYKTPTVFANDVIFTESKNGMSYHQFVVPDQKVFVLSGTVTVLNKSGIPKVMPFEKTIRVLPKEK